MMFAQFSSPDLLTMLGVTVETKMSFLSLKPSQDLAYGGDTENVC